GSREHLEHLERRLQALVLTCTPPPLRDRVRTTQRGEVLWTDGDHRIQAPRLFFERRFAIELESARIRTHCVQWRDVQHRHPALGSSGDVRITCCGALGQLDEPLGGSLAARELRVPFPWLGGTLCPF